MEELGRKLRFFASEVKKAKMGNPRAGRFDRLDGKSLVIDELDAQVSQRALRVVCRSLFCAAG